MEFVNVRDMRRLGCTRVLRAAATRATPKKPSGATRLTVGKGLYNDVDVFFSFIPPTGGTRVSDYGAAARWSFYQAQIPPDQRIGLGSILIS